MILGSENLPQTVSQLASQSHMFYVSGGKSIDRNISSSYWFVIDYCFLVTQWLMIILFFGPEGYMSYSLTPHIFFPSRLKIVSWLGFSFGTFTLERCWSPDPRFSLNSCLFSHSHAIIALSENLLACWASLDIFQTEHSLETCLSFCFFLNWHNSVDSQTTNLWMPLIF